MSRLTNLLALFQDALAVRGWAMPEYRRQYTPTGRISRNYRPTQRTAAERHWHDRNDPVQASRIEAAEDKRLRKASTYSRNIGYAIDCNRAHDGPFEHTLNPFYIAK